MPAEVGVAYVTLLPSMSKFNSAVQSSLRGSNPLGGLADSGGDAGAKAGRSFATSFMSRASGVAGGLSSLLSGAASVGASMGQRIAGGIRQAYGAVGDVMQGVGTAQVSAAGRGLGIDFGRSMADGITSTRIAVGAVVGNLVTGAVSAATGSLGRAIKRVDTMNNFPEVMANIGIDKASAQGAIQTLSESIEGLPTALDDLVSFAQKIAPSMGRDMDKATESAVAFNHAIVAGGKDVALQANALEQWSQMLGVGKVDMAAFRSVINAAPAQLQQVAESMGFSSSMELYENLVGSERGTIPIEELNEAFIRLDKEGLGQYASFAEQAAIATNGIGTAITNAGNRIAKATASIIDWVGQASIADAINGVTKGLGPAAKRLTDFLESIDAKGQVGRLFEVVGNGARSLATAFEPAADAIRPLVGELLPTALALAGDVLDALETHGSRLAGGVSNFFSYVNANLPTLRGWAGDIIDALVDVKLGTLEAALRMWQQLISAMGPVLPQVMESFGAVSQSVASLVGNVSGVLAPVVADLFTTVAAAIEASRPFLERIVTALAPAFSDMVGHVGEVATTLMAHIAPVAEQMAPMLENVMGAAGQTAKRLIETIAPHVPAMAEAAERIVVALAPAVDRVTQAISPLIDPLADLFATAAETFAPAMSTLAEALSPQLQGVVEAAKGLVESLGPTLPGIVTALTLLKGAGSLGIDLGGIDLGQVAAQAAQMGTTIVGAIRTAFGSAFEGLLTTAVSSATSGMPGVITDVTTKLAGAFGSLATLPSGVIVGALAAIVGSLVYCWQNSERFRDTVTGAFETIATAVGSFAGTVMPYVQALWDAASPLLEAMALLVGDTFAGAFKAAADTVKNALEAISGLVRALAGIFETAFGAIKGLLTGDWSLMFKGAEDVLAGFGQFFGSVFRGIYDLAKDVIETIGQGFSDLFGGIGDFLGGVGDLLGPLRMSDVSPTRPFATGGIVTAPTRAVIGEAGRPEAVVPLTAEGISQFVGGLSPLRQGVGGGYSVNVSIETFVNQDTTQDIRSLSDRIGRDTIQQLKEQGVAA